MEQQLIDEVEAKRDFDQNWFVSPDCQATYYEDLARKKLFLKRGISLERIPETLSAFYERLETMRWLCFAPKPCYSNEQWVREFYTNLKAVRLSTSVMKKRDKVVHFEVEKINRVYGLLDAD